MNMARSPCVPAGSSSQPTEWHHTPISGATREKFKLGFPPAGDCKELIYDKELVYDIVSRSSSLRFPGTRATGMGNSPAFLMSADTSGPGPSFPVPAASTK